MTRKRDVLDGAEGVVRHSSHAQLDQVAEAVLLLGDDEEPAEQVLHQPLRPETERGAQHGGRRHQ